MSHPLEDRFDALPGAMVKSQVSGAQTKHKGAEKARKPAARRA